MQAFGIISLALALSSPAEQSTPPWVMGACTISRTSGDGAVWSVRRQGRGALLTVTKPRWALPKGETLNLYLYFGGGGFGHYRPATAHRVPGKPTLTFTLDDELVLGFRGFTGVRIIGGGEHDLTGWLDLEGSAKAYSSLARC